MLVRETTVIYTDKKRLVKKTRVSNHKFSYARTRLSRAQTFRPTNLSSTLSAVVALIFCMSEAPEIADYYPEVCWGSGAVWSQTSPALGRGAEE